MFASLKPSKIWIRNQSLAEVSTRFDDHVYYLFLQNIRRFVNGILFMFLLSKLKNMAKSL